MSFLQVIILILLGAASLGILTTALSLWLVGRWFRIEGASWRRALMASSILMLLNIALAVAMLAREESLERRPTAGPGADIAVTVLACLFIAVLFVKLSLRITFRRAVLPSVAFLCLYGTFCMAIILPVRRWLLEAFSIPTNAMAPTLLGDHTSILCKACGAALTLGIRTDPSGRPAGGREERAVTCSRCGASLGAPSAPRVLSGDRILVDKISTPARWDLFTFRYPRNPDEIYVKRLVGLPRERVEIAGGETFIDGKLQRKAPGSAEELWIPVHEDEGSPADGKLLRDSGWKPEREASGWRRSPAGWTFAGSGEDKLVFQGRINDRMDYNSLYLEPQSPRAAKPVGDVRVEFVLERWDGAGSLRFEWERAGRSVKAEVTADGALELKSDGTTATGTLRSALSGGPRLAFAVRDGQAYFSTGEKVICSLDFDSPTVEALRGARSDLPLRLAIGAHRSSLEIRRLTVRRDIYYREDIPGNRVEAFTLKADEYFVLGDNPMRSSDSRVWGPVPVANLQGVVRWIFWPFGRITELPRRLGSN